MGLTFWALGLVCFTAIFGAMQILVLPMPSMTTVNNFLCELLIIVFTTHTDQVRNSTLFVLPLFLILSIFFFFFYFLFDKLHFLD